MIPLFIIAFILYKITGNKIWLVFFLIIGGISFLLVLVEAFSQPRTTGYPDAIPGIPAPNSTSQQY